MRLTTSYPASTLTPAFSYALAFGWPFYLFWLPLWRGAVAKRLRGGKRLWFKRIVIEWVGGELFGIRLHGVVLVADVLALVQREFRQTHTVLGREGLQEVGLVVVERTGVVAVEVGDAQATVWGRRRSVRWIDQTVERKVGQGIRADVFTISSTLILAAMSSLVVEISMP